MPMNLTFKNNDPFVLYVSKVNNTVNDNGEDLDIVMPIDSLLEYRDNYFMTSRSLQNYYRDEVKDDANEKMMLVIIG